MPLHGRRQERSGSTSANWSALTTTSMIVRRDDDVPGEGDGCVSAAVAGLISPLELLRAGISPIASLQLFLNAPRSGLGAPPATTQV
ncbi:hypothetical protein MSG28_012432 [Choristoneura fumiferana]|uniref:Uncharacterized protein n=1 Tax=Choristoneura fumiferana TaxID=7141 RepID=A0ACC0KD62_CHOFU|nr:hypothetical protein MSG28_012432 [Choristoneura fumiferana]